jgi:hypothetical protein
MVKLSVVMSAPKLNVVSAPPSLTKSLMAGFDTVSNHIWLILFTFFLDIFLWFGPRLRVLGIFQRAFERMMSYPEMKSSEMMDTMQITQDFWLSFSESFNLFTFLRTLPVGVPSLMASRNPIEMPFGIPIILEINSTGAALGLILGLSVLGILAGTLYFLFIAQAATTKAITWHQAVSQWPWASFQILLLTILAFVLLFLLALPISCLLSVIMLSGLGLERFGFILFLIAGGLMFWWLIPLFFTPHGIFLKHHGIRKSILESIRITRATLPISGFLVLILIIISEGLKLLWRVPPENSWFTLVGIVGHSFVVTSLIAASFVYYHKADQWVNSEERQIVV